jgi:hypothetical protein
MFAHDPSWFVEAPTVHAPVYSQLLLVQAQVPAAHEQYDSYTKQSAEMPGSSVEPSGGVHPERSPPSAARMSGQRFSGTLWINGPASLYVATFTDPRLRGSSQQSAAETHSPVHILPVPASAGGTGNVV